MSDTFTVTRSTTIDAPPDRVYAELIDFNKWTGWSPWESMDPNMDKSFFGAESGVGSQYAWSGNRKVGQGSMEITDAKEHSEINIDLEFLKPFKASNKTRFTLEQAGGGTTVTWAMTGQKTLMTRIIGIFRSMDAMIGPDFERGLANLKSTTEGSAS